MEPILTLPYSEWLVAEELMDRFPPRDGYSVFAPLSRQQKGVDLLLTRRSDRRTTTAALQIKYSRAYEQRAAFRFGIWFKVFTVPPEADFIVLSALFPQTDGKGGSRRDTWWAPLFLLFTHDEMNDVFANLRTRSGKPDAMFAFGFSSPDHVTLIRGDQERAKPDFSSYLLPNRIEILREHLDAL